jgi:hypothetical protein
MCRLKLIAAILLTFFVANRSSSTPLIATVDGTGEWAVRNSASGGPPDVLVFYSPDDVKRPYEVIGEIDTAASSGWLKSEGDLTGKAREEAAKLGANAIIIRAFDKGTGGDRAAAIFLGTNDQKQHVTAIRFTN